jgi:hypothetical protein
MIYFGFRSDPIDNKKFYKFRTIPLRNHYSDSFSPKLFFIEKEFRPNQSSSHSVSAADSSFLLKKGRCIRDNSLSHSLNSDRMSYVFSTSFRLFHLLILRTISSLLPLSPSLPSLSLHLTSLSRILTITLIFRHHLKKSPYISRISHH